MQRGNENQCQIIQGKKSQKIDDDVKINKKHQKNNWKKYNRQQNNKEDIQSYIQQVKPSKKIENHVNLKKKFTTRPTQQQSMIQQLQRVYIQTSRSTIQKCLQKAGYNIQLAQNLLVEQITKQEDMSSIFQKAQQKQQGSKVQAAKIQPQKIQIQRHKNVITRKKKDQQSYPKLQSKNGTSSNRKNQTEQQAYKLLNQFYDKKDLEISGFQFQQLFNQITQIIKEDQQKHGKALIQITELVDSCITVKDTILVGLQDVFQLQDDVHFNQGDPVHLQIQQFIFDLNKKSVQKEVIKVAEFPTLGQAMKKKKNKQRKNQQSPPKRSIINELQQQSHYFSPVSKNGYFNGNARPIVFQQKNIKGIFNVDNQQQSQDSLRHLSKQYKHISIQTLKLVYICLQKNYNLSRSFLDQYYGKQAKDLPKITVESRSNSESNGVKRNKLNVFRKESIQQIDQELLNWSFREIRDQIEHLYHLRQVFLMTCNGIKNTNLRKDLFRMADQKAPLHLIRKLSKAARVKLINDTMQSDPNYVDLHGHREEQVSPILEGLIASIHEQFDLGNQKLKYKTINGRIQAVIQINTGKGIHSKQGKSILKPCVKSWCDNNKLRAIINDDNVQIYIPLN